MLVFFLDFMSDFGSSVAFLKNVKMHIDMMPRKLHYKLKFQSLVNIDVVIGNFCCGEDPNLQSSCRRFGPYFLCHFCIMFM